MSLKPTAESIFSCGIASGFRTRNLIASGGKIPGPERKDFRHSHIEQNKELPEGCRRGDGGRPSQVFPRGAAFFPEYGRKVGEGDRGIYCVSK